ncbi:hypothetical protein Daura_29235 [Dactylosporangium aurantiacum]|uniref:Uncharacterized protein n=1 Tax=Dactylosporangium aurantiacum TaxID=35754 RepID=A0A9Q9IAK5_9ACTN|nr:hypothetical protein [Dactylosporangium aurantiacum]MDG6106737.1 hypothetical protein [Dactylosporangium aurantiacum]UWZ50885.1 hypothetical protein Daura_29235 [Dactylosporangium aurantiacum]
MTINDVRELCELTLGVDAPPLRTADRALAIAARASARRDRLVAASVGLAGVTVAAALVTPALLPASAPAPAVVAAPAPSVSTAVPSVAPVRSATAPASHDRRMYDVLVAALPAGYHGSTRYPFAEPSQSPIRIDSPPPSTPLYIHAYAEVTVSDGRGEGDLFAAIAADGSPLPTGGDLCALPEAGRECRVIDVAGVPVRVGLEDDELGGDVLVARRYLDGGFLMLAAQRSVPEIGLGTPQRQPSLKPALGAPFLTAEQLAAIAANPAMLP